MFLHKYHVSFTIVYSVNHQLQGKFVAPIKQTRPIFIFKNDQLLESTLWYILRKMSLMQTGLITVVINYTIKIKENYVRL